MKTILIITIAALAAGCGGSNAPSKIALDELHNCRIAQVGVTREVAFRSAIEPDVTVHSGAAIITTIDSYADSGVTMTWQHGVLVKKQCKA